VECNLEEIESTPVTHDLKNLINTCSIYDVRVKNERTWSHTGWHHSECDKMFLPGNARKGSCLRALAIGVLLSNQ